jgi:hypothetical protein
MALVTLLVGCRSAESRALDHVQRGEAYLAKKDYASARIEFGNAAQLNPRLFEAHYHLAQVQLALRIGSARRVRSIGPCVWRRTEWIFD